MGYRHLSHLRAEVRIHGDSFIVVREEGGGGE